MEITRSHLRISVNLWVSSFTSNKIAFIFLQSAVFFIAASSETSPTVIFHPSASELSDKYLINEVDDLPAPNNNIFAMIYVFNIRLQRYQTFSDLTMISLNDNNKP